jgi:hypothetical protein
MTAPTGTTTTEEPEIEPVDPATVVDEDEEARAALADKGKQALDRMKAERNATKAELAKYKALGLDPDKLQELIGKSETDKQAAEQEKVRREAETAALTKANGRLVRAQVTLAATGRLKNPAVALKLLDLSSFDVDDDGEVDAAAITAAVDELLTEYPELAQGEDKRFQGTGDAGAKSTPAGVKQLTQADLDRMNDAKDYAGIAKARADGLFDTLLGITRT